MSKTVLVTGATGKQGGAVVAALIAANPSPPLTILALTRNTDSPSAASLLKRYPSVKLVAGDFNDSPAIFAAAAQPIWGVFSVQGITPKPSAAVLEEKQGKAFVDAAVAHGVRHFVYTSADRGGPGVSETNPSPVAHIASKHRIEEHLKARSAEAGMTWTILRPTMFMENLAPGFFGKFCVTAIDIHFSADTKGRWIACEDIGWFGAQALLEPEKWKGRAVTLAGDEKTKAEMDEVFREKTGQPAPRTYAWLARAMLLMMGEFRTMFVWLGEGDFDKVSVQDTRAIYPGMTSLAEWVEKSPYVAKK
ncbi:MAG: hypothetical protein M1833_004012 [Piccolia ochrophora]|nr:MAG: hypothetical protein M1833_004012 [Piccolia ochrophora]